MQSPSKRDKQTLVTEKYLDIDEINENFIKILKEAAEGGRGEREWWGRRRGRVGREQK